MSFSERQKGIVAEGEVRKLLEQAGWTVRGLEGLGDQLAFSPAGTLLHVEVKRQERLQLPIWLRQAAAEAPAEAVPLVAFRQNRSRWYGVAPLDALLELLR